jgi:alkylation response protein AidB-like acyl-CoA dehydrogenase
MSLSTLAQANERAEQWEKRAQQLQQKYGKVDLAEHQRVQEMLSKAEAELAQLRSTSENSDEALRTELEKVLVVWPTPFFPPRDIASLCQC